MSERKLGRYQEKRRLGLVPFTYDTHGKSFAMGAHKNWPSNSTDAQRRSLAAQDALSLRLAREAR